MPQLHVRLYGKPGCELCASAGKMLTCLQEEFNFWVEDINILTDPALRERLHTQIPIVTIDGGNRVVAEKLSEDRLRRALKRAKQQRESGEPGAFDTSTHEGAGQDEPLSHFGL